MIMVTLLELKKAKMAALKEHDVNKQNVLGVLIANFQKAEIEKKAKCQELTDADIVSLLNKALKELEDEKEMYANGGKPVEAENSQIQIDIIKGYLPQMMSEDEIRNVINSLADKSIKSVMIEFKTKYAGKADMSLVNRIAKEFQK